MSRNSNAGRMRAIALGAVLLLLCASSVLAHGQHSAPPRPRFAAPQVRAQRQQARQQARQQRGQGRLQGPYQGQFQSRPQAAPTQQPEAGNRVPPAGAAYPSANYNGSYARPGYAGPASGPANRPAYNYPGYAPPGHLQSWLNQHRGLPLQDQERLLRNDPAFMRQNPAEQQREVQQLHQVDQMPEQQRERRLARNEMLERLSPQQRMNLNQASRQFATLPPDRRRTMSRAFQDLRSVPLDQRPTVLNSARYQGQFSPQEREILSNFLSVEPYEPAR